MKYLIDHIRSKKFIKRLSSADLTVLFVLITTNRTNKKKQKQTNKQEQTKTNKQTKQVV